MQKTEELSHGQMADFVEIAMYRFVLMSILAAAYLFAPTPSLLAADRTTLYIPLASDTKPETMRDGRRADQIQYPDDAMGAAASDGWKAYIRLWKAHHNEPSNPKIRRFLGLPLEKSFHVTAKKGRGAPKLLRWTANSYAQVDTPHFVIYSKASEQSSLLVAEDLERSYWAWTQMFFPLWEAAAQVSAAISEMPEDMSVSEFLEENSSRITIRRKMRVVLLKDAADYQNTLAREVPGIERSTGYYDNFNQTIYLYASGSDDSATRRHELVHQMFREATRAGLRNKMPAENDGFWLIEGIAGYFESLWFGKHYATVGGWDSSRLQFARYRILVNRDQMPMSELRADGFTSAQKRSDLSRWYSHAIAQTHQLMESGNPASRLAIYRELARLYKIRSKLPSVDQNELLGAADQGIRKFLAIDDEHILSNPIVSPPHQLVLADCQVTAQGLEVIPPSSELDWLDLAGAPITNGDVSRLVPNPSSLGQLRLERTRIDTAIAPWLSQATNLRELDLSSTRVGDKPIESLAAPNLEVLWLTGSTVSDASIDAISKMNSLQSVDLQKTKVTPEGINRLRTARPQLEINPLQVN